MILARFDIFLGRFREEDAYWVDAVMGFEDAYQTMASSSGGQARPLLYL